MTLMKIRKRKTDIQQATNALSFTLKKKIVWASTTEKQQQKFCEIAIAHTVNHLWFCVLLRFLKRNILPLPQVNEKKTIARSSTFPRVCF